MEKISAACAMEWSIELDKSLRSKRPGQAIKAIQQIGARLQRWSREPKPAIAAYSIFGLVMGEDRLFANTILLRLADVFRLGDKDIRLSVVRVFLSEFRNHHKDREVKRILSKYRLENHMELLKRVKFAFDTGDTESRALALVLFGCWADFAKDSAHIRYLILSGLVSSELLEVKASLFAAGCFCELAADFASVVLEMLLNIILSPATSLTIRLSGIRVFAKMRSSYSIANRAYKIGLKLVLDSSEEDLLIAMLISLSKLATRVALLLSEQVDLLLSFLSSERTLHLQAMALRCLHFVLVRGVCQSSVNSMVIKTLLKIVDKIGLPPAMHCEALQILKKILVYGLPKLPCDSMLVAQFLNVTEKAAKSPILPNSILAVQVLVDASIMLRGRNKIGSDVDCFLFSSKQIISVIMDQIIQLVKPLLDVCQNNSKAFQTFQSLLNLLLCLVGEHPDLGVTVLDKVRSLIELIVDNLERKGATRQASASVDGLDDFKGENGIGFSLILIHNIHKFSASCIENLRDIGTVTVEILHEVQVLVECVQCCGLFDNYIHLIYSILLHSHIIWRCVLNKNEGSFSISENLGNSHCDHFFAHEILSLELSEKMMTQKDNWPAYKAGIFAAYQGAWVTALFIFGQLIGKTQSNSCSCWLKGLSLLAQSEVKIQLFLLPNLRLSLVNWLQTKELYTTLFFDNHDEIFQDAAGNINKPDFTKVLVGAYHDLCSSGEKLKSMAMLEKSCFQRWFLALREKVLRTVAETLEVLSSMPLIKDNIIKKSEKVDTSNIVDCLNSLRQITQISYQFKGLAQEFDLIAMSFSGMDARSSKIISSFALSCSVLAFATGFFLFFSNLPDHEILTCGLECSSSYLQQMLILSLVGKLWFIDEETCSKLFLLSECSGQGKDCFHMQPRNQILKFGGEARDILNICEDAVSGILGLQNETKGVPIEEILSHIAECGFKLVSKTITKWMNIPFRFPKYFFTLRPCFGSELFAFSADTRKPYELTSLPGFHLSLNLCLQLRNMPPYLPIQTIKLYCVICSSASFQESKSKEETRGEMQLDYKSWEVSTMITLNEKLFRYVKDCSEKNGNGKRGRDCNNGGDDRNVYGFVCFEVNERGQGFSNCLLDVSYFHAGSYRIKWHSCFIDSQGSYWSLIPLNAGPVFTVQESLV